MRRSVADLREARYRLLGKDCYVSPFFFFNILCNHMGRCCFVLTVYYQLMSSNYVLCFGSYLLCQFHGSFRETYMFKISHFNMGLTF